MARKHTNSVDDLVNHHLTKLKLLVLLIFVVDTLRDHTNALVTFPTGTTVCSMALIILVQSTNS